MEKSTVQLYLICILKCSVGLGIKFLHSDENAFNIRTSRNIYQLHCVAYLHESTDIEVQ
jgi:hypothetical protein